MNLTNILKKNLNWNAARISLLANMVIALLKTRTVCLTEIATALSGKAKIKSKYRRLQRFFASFSMDMESISRMMANILPISKENMKYNFD